MPHPLDKKRTFYIICLIVLVLLRLASLFLESRPSFITLWTITDRSNLDSEILWQKYYPCLGYGRTTPHGAVAVSQSQVVVYRSCLGIIDGNFIALDLFTGHESWYSGADGGLQVINVGDGYLVVFDHIIVKKLNYTGRTVWETRQFPSRSMDAVFPQDGLIYAPFRTADNASVLMLSTQTGQLLENIEDENIIGIFNDFIVRHTDRDTIEVMDAENEHVIWSTSIMVAGYKPSFKDVNRINNVLLLYSRRERVDAYDIHTGERLWSLEQNTGSYPLLLQNTLFVYGLDNRLRAYDPEDGQLIGYITLKRNDDSDPNSGKPETNVALAGYGDVLSLAFRNTHELVTLQVYVDSF